MQTKIGLAGAGSFGTFLVSSLKGLEDISITSLFGKGEEQTRQQAIALSIPQWFTDFDTFLAQEDLDFIILSTPPYTHATMAIQAMKAGKAIFIEKPACMTYEEGHQLIETHKQTKIPAIVDFLMRYNPIYQMIKQLTTKEVFGKLRSAHFLNFATNEGLDADHWFWDTSKSGGIFVEHGVHFFDVYGWVINGMPHHLTSTVMTNDIGQHDQVEATIVYDNNTIASYFHAFNKPKLLEKQEGTFSFDTGFCTIKGWIAEEMTIDALLSDEHIDTLKELGFTIDSVEDISSQKVQTNGCTYHITKHVRASFAHTLKKQELYVQGIRDIVSDFQKSLYDPSYTPKVTLWDGIASSFIAYAATNNENREKFPAELTWLKSEKA